MENYRIILEKTLEQVKQSDKKPTLLLHSCCGPCSSAVLELLCEYFEVTVYFYNPNMDTANEHEKRFLAQKQIIDALPQAKGVKLIKGEYDHNGFLQAIKGNEADREGGGRCTKCFEYRLKSARDKACGYDWFATTLTVSPHKNAVVINEIGKTLENGGAKYLISDFKKKEGYKRSIELSKQYDLYRQTYCGCEFSK